jgi:hypothetical protein
MKLHILFVIDQQGRPSAIECVSEYDHLLRPEWLEERARRVRWSSAFARVGVVVIDLGADGAEQVQRAMEEGVEIAGKAVGK